MMMKWRKIIASPSPTKKNMNYEIWTLNESNDDDDDDDESMMKEC